MHGYPPIADHGLIGDLHTSALVCLDGTIDWFCHPRFDSPSVFACLLDDEVGGHFKIAPVGDGYVTRQLYLPGTAILITRFMGPAGVGEVIDFMPVAPPTVTDRHTVVRIVRVVRGDVRFAIDCQPRFDYGRSEHKTEITADGVAFHDGNGTGLALSVLRRTGHEGEALPVQRIGNGVHAIVDASVGEVGGVILETGAEARPHAFAAPHILELFRETREYWLAWRDRSRYTGRWREAVERSAITLKLMTYAPTGALVAAPTAGLPEQAGGERNWDYRYTWVRDGSFSVHALLGLGYTAEAEGFLGWLGDRLRDSENSSMDSAPLNIMYRVDGSSALTEEVLDHLHGWRGSRPVRIGNDASGQLQLDIFGEAIDSVWRGDREGLHLPDAGWQNVRRVLNWMSDNWDRVDDGIWETRGGRQPFTYSRLMSWVALDRGIRLATSLARPAEVDRWQLARDAIYTQVMSRAWNAQRQAFVQHANTDVLDAALLYMPLVGFVSPTDPRWLSTLRAMDSELVSDSLVYRYNPSASPDGLRGSEGTFSMCSFWYVDTLARAGRLDEAALAFEKMLTYANHVGLYAEEIGSTGEHLGNFPQAFTHLALISSAINLDRELDRGVRARAHAAV